MPPVSNFTAEVWTNHCMNICQVLWTIKLKTFFNSALACLSLNRWRGFQILTCLYFNIFCFLIFLKRTCILFTMNKTIMFIPSLDDFYPLKFFLILRQKSLYLLSPLKIVYLLVHYRSNLISFPYYSLATFYFHLSLSSG